MGETRSVSVLGYPLMLMGRARGLGLPNRVAGFPRPIRKISGPPYELQTLIPKPPAFYAVKFAPCEPLTSDRSLPAVAGLLTSDF